MHSTENESKDCNRLFGMTLRNSSLMHQLTQASTGHPINIGGLSVQGVMVLEDNGIIQGIVLGVNELGSKGVKTMVLETWVY